MHLHNALKTLLAPDSMLNLATRNSPPHCTCPIVWTWYSNRAQPVSCLPVLVSPSFVPYSHLAWCCLVVVQEISARWYWRLIIVDWDIRNWTRGATSSTSLGQFSVFSNSLFSFFIFSKYVRARKETKYTRRCKKDQFCYKSCCHSGTCYQAIVWRILMHM